jgi:hypothetical protein
MVTLGVVRWTKGKQFGVEFIKMDQANRLALDQFLSQHLPDKAGLRTTRKAFSDPGGQNWHLDTYSVFGEH